MTDLSLKQACAETQKFGRMLKGLERLVEVAAALESADQAVADRRREESQIVARVAAATTQLEETLTRLTAANEAAASATAAAESKAAEILAAAREEAERIFTEARKAEFHANGKVTCAVGKAKDAELRLKIAQEELAAVEVRLEQAKAEGRKIFGS